MYERFVSNAKKEMSKELVLPTEDCKMMLRSLSTCIIFLSVKNLISPVIIQTFIISKNWQAFGGFVTFACLHSFSLRIACLFLTGPTGNIIVDTTESEEISTLVYKQFYKISPQPLKAIVLTHFHAGIEVFCV